MKNISQKINIQKVILFFVFHKLLIKCESQCSYYKDCFNCTMCGDENSKSCNCSWETVNGQSFCKSNELKYLAEWYSELLKCKDNDDQSIYCSGEDIEYSREDLDKDYSIIFQINEDNKRNYGKKMLFCYYNYIDDISNDYILNIEFSNSITNKPKVVYGCSFNNNEQEKIQKIEENKEISCSNSYKIFFAALLSEKYTSSPIILKITLKNIYIYKYVTAFSIALIIILIITCIICCITRYYNNKSRRQMRLIMYQRARENMIRIEQEINNLNNFNENNENIEDINKEKLNELFSRKMAEHYYKSEYNEYGGGCSICLENFKKKSKVSITPCKHVFHYKCIKDWLYKNAKNPKCPNCNKEVLVDDESDFNEKIEDTKIIKVKKKQQNNVLNNNLNFASRSSNISTINMNNNRGNNNNVGRGDFSQSQRQQLGAY